MSLQTRLSALITAIGADIKNHNTRLATLEAQTGIILDVQSKSGAGTGYVAIATGGTFQMGGTAGAMALTYTPTVNCWWEVEAFVGILDKTDAAYHYGYVYLELSPADARGMIQAYQIFTQAQNVDRYGFRNPKRMWKLNAGTAYTCTAKFSTPGGTWQYTQLSPYHHIQGKAWSR